MGLLDHVPRASAVTPPPAPPPEADEIPEECEPCQDDEDDLDADKQAALHRDLLVLDFAEYCREAWAVTNPSTRLVWNWHHALTCEVLQALFETWLRAQRDPDYLPPIVNTLVNQPPGSTKSTLASIDFPTWVWLRAPGARFTCISVNEDVALRDARAARTLIESPWYQRTFAPSWRIRGDQNAISNYATTEGGVRISKPAGSHVVGLRGSFLLADDFDDPNDVDNKTKREAALKLWDDALYSRVDDADRSMRIGLQQRVGAIDWTGHVIEKQGLWSPENRFGWHQVALPAEYRAELRYSMPRVLREALGTLEPSERVVLEDPRKVEGESLHPERFSPEFLASEKRRWEGTGNYSAQYLQLPLSQEGAQVKREWFSFAELDAGVVEAHDASAAARQHPRPAMCRRDRAHLVGVGLNRPGWWNFDWTAISVDCAAKETERGSQWGLLCGAGQGGRRFVLDDRTRRGDILAILDVLRDMVKLWRPDALLIEDKAAGPDLIVRVRTEMQKGGLPPMEVVVVKPGAQGKQQRLMACVPTIASGMLHLLDGAEWLEAFVDEVCAFPNGVQNDRVDSLSQLLNHYAEQESVQLPDW